MTSPSASLGADFWEQRYQEGTARWDLGKPAPPFVSLLDASTAPIPGRMAVLGCGRGYEAVLFASKGFEVVGFDFAPSAIASAMALAQEYGAAAEFLQRDIFELIPEFENSFDYVVEHTCFCAIAPEQRLAYVELVQSLLRAGGELVALFWAHSRLGGPPYGTTSEEIRQYFSPAFEILSLELVTDSVEMRRDEEYLGRFRVKG